MDHNFPKQIESSTLGSGTWNSAKEIAVEYEGNDEGDFASIYTKDFTESQLYYILSYLSYQNIVVIFQLVKFLIYSNYVAMYLKHIGF